MENNLENLLNKFISWGLAVFAFLLPLFFLPVTTNFYAFNKQALLVAAAALFLLAWFARMVASGQVKVRCTPFDLPILFFAAVFVASTILVTPNKVEALITPGETTTIIALTALYFVITNNLKPSAIRYTLNALIASAAILSLLAIYQFIGLGETFAPWEWMKAKTWTPAGSPLGLLAFLIPIFFLLLIRFLTELGRREEVTGSIVQGILTILLGIASVLTIILIFPGKPTAALLLPQRTGWMIAIEAFKQAPLLGTGPATYVTAFTRFKPLGLNLGDLWNIRFGSSSNYYFYLLTTTGVLGLAAYILLVARFAKRIVSIRGGKGIVAATASAFILQLILPGNFLLISLTFLLLALFAASGPTEERTLSLAALGGAETKQSEILPWLFFIPAVLLVLATFYLGGRAYAAEIYFKQSLDALVANRGTDAYNLQIKTITTNPYLDSYRVAYSQTNFALANAIAGQADLSDQDRNNISQLIQQAIREAKVATVLNPQKAFNWENLATLYRNLINFAQGADQWAIAAYQQAIFLDAANPLLRVNLGGLYYSLADYENAVRNFQIAVNLKPDYANGHYNLVAAYREQGKFAQAVQEMEIVLNLVPTDSGDFQKATSELAELREKLPPEEATPSAKPAETLTPPSPLPSPAIEPPIELPEEAGPEISPTPTPTPPIKATPTPTPG